MSFYWLGHLQAKNQRVRKQVIKIISTQRRFRLCFALCFARLPKSLFIDSEFRGGKIQPLLKKSFHLTPLFEGNFRAFEKSLYLTYFLGRFFTLFWVTFEKQHFSLYAFLQDSVIALMESLSQIFR